MCPPVGLALIMTDLGEHLYKFDLLDVDVQHYIVEGLAI